MALKNLITTIQAHPLDAGHPLLRGLIQGIPAGLLASLGLKPSRKYYNHPHSTVVAFYAQTNTGVYMAFQAPANCLTQVTALVSPTTQVVRRWDLRTYAQDACRRLVADNICVVGEGGVANQTRNAVSLNLRKTLLELANADRFEDFSNDLLGIMMEQLFRKDVPLNAESLIYMAGKTPEAVGVAIAQRILLRQPAEASSGLLNDLAHLLGEGNYTRDLFDGKLPFGVLPSRTLQFYRPATP